MRSVGVTFDDERDENAGASAPHFDLLFFLHGNLHEVFHAVIRLVAVSRRSILLKDALNADDVLFAVSCRHPLVLRRTIDGRDKC